MELDGYLILTIDVEDWFQSTWDSSFAIRDEAKKNTEYLLNILSFFSRKATMFVSGKFAHTFPDLIKNMHKEGHSIASHSYLHENLLYMKENDFRDDLNKSKIIIEDIIGEKVIGYRAPDFSINESNLYMLNILSEEGFIYDSSIFPMKLKRYGLNSWTPYPQKIILNNKAFIYEFPIGISYFAGLKIPIGGGGYHRLFPKWYILKMIKKALRINKYFVYYCHPYEFNYKELRQSNIKIPYYIKLHQGLGRKGYEGKFRTLLQYFKTYKIEDIIKSCNVEEIKIEGN